MTWLERGEPLSGSIARGILRVTPASASEGERPIPPITLRRMGPGQASCRHSVSVFAFPRRLVALRRLPHRRSWALGGA